MKVMYPSLLSSNMIAVAQKLNESLKKKKTISHFFSQSNTSFKVRSNVGQINYDDDDYSNNNDDDDDNNNDLNDDDVFPKNVFFVGLLQLKPYQSDQRCLKASV